MKENLKNLINNLEFHILKQESLHKEYETYVTPPKSLLVRMQENSNYIIQLKHKLQQYDKKIQSH